MPRNAAIDPTTIQDEDIVTAADSDVPVLITSPHRNQRAALARALHALGPRGSAALVEFDCATGRTPEGDRPPQSAADHADVEEIRRRFRGASNGTIFLDRIDVMSRAVQVELSRLLDETALDSRAAFHDGGCRPRIVSGASRSLLAGVAAGSFDERLFYRLNVIHIEFTRHRPEKQP